MTTWKFSTQSMGWNQPLTQEPSAFRASPATGFSEIDGLKKYARPSERSIPAYIGDEESTIGASTEQNVGRDRPGVKAETKRRGFSKFDAITDPSQETTPERQKAAADLAALIRRRTGHEAPKVELVDRIVPHDKRFASSALGA